MMYNRIMCRTKLKAISKRRKAKLLPENPLKIRPHYLNQKMVPISDFGIMNPYAPNQTFSPECPILLVVLVVKTKHT